MTKLSIRREYKFEAQDGNPFSTGHKPQDLEEIDGAIVLSSLSVGTSVNEDALWPITELGFRATRSSPISRGAIYGLLWAHTLARNRGIVLARDVRMPGSSVAIRATEDLRTNYTDLAQEIGKKCLKH